MWGGEEAMQLSVTRLRERKRQLGGVVSNLLLLPSGGWKRDNYSGKYKVSMHAIKKEK